VYWTSQLTAGWRYLVRSALPAALPGVSVEVLPDPDVDVLSINPPEGTGQDEAREATQLATHAVERAAEGVKPSVRREKVLVFSPNTFSRRTLAASPFRSPDQQTR